MTVRNGAVRRPAVRRLLPFANDRFMDAHFDPNTSPLKWLTSMTSFEVRISGS
jgi:hypothetical protein